MEIIKKVKNFFKRRKLLRNPIKAFETISVAGETCYWAVCISLTDFYNYVESLVNSREFPVPVITNICTWILSYNNYKYLVIGCKSASHKYQKSLKYLHESKVHKELFFIEENVTFSEKTGKENITLKMEDIKQILRCVLVFMEKFSGNLIKKQVNLETELVYL